MRLVSLTANQASFQPIKFNPNGLTLIIGKKTNPDDTDVSRSTNGVGKSLALYLISFCLGSNSNSELNDKLDEWEFTLKFAVGDDQYIVTRACSEQSKFHVSINEERFTWRQQEWTRHLGEKVFRLNQSQKHLSFRSLLSPFLRFGKSAYNNELKAQSGETEFQQKLRACYLMGIEVTLVRKKAELRDEQLSLEDIEKQFKRDSFLRDYYEGERSAELDLHKVNQKVSDLSKKLESFIVAEDYSRIIDEAEETKRKWQQLKNELSALQNSIKQIENSLGVQPDVSANQIINMYQEASAALPELITKRLEELSEFHRKLIRSREERLTIQKQTFERKISDLEAELKALNRKKDVYYEYLGSRGALEEYETLHRQLADSKVELERLTAFSELEKKTKKRLQEIIIDQAKENIRAEEYLESAAHLRNTLRDRFESIAKRMWPSHTCGLVISNNEKENKIRFNIDAAIQGDSSDGIGETKIFCFDFTTLLSNGTHRMKFLMHDSRLFQGIDPRQCAELFKIADEMGRRFDCQYIASLNDANLEEIRKVMTPPEEFETTMKKNIVLNLEDSSPDKKLLGVLIDLKYDRTK